MRTRQVILFTSLVLSIAASSTAWSQVVQPICDSEVRKIVATELANIAALPEAENLDAERALYQEYSFCAADSTLDDTEFLAAVRQCTATVSQLGSRFYEEMSCCGYDPQRRQFGCPVKIKQRFGFGAAPLPGSREHVLHCVRNAAGTLVPVGDDSVHLANEIFGVNPSWQFAVIANANDSLRLMYPMDGQTRSVRSILSWGFRPTSCNFQPIWGNALNYRIRLDQ